MARPCFSRMELLIATLAVAIAVAVLIPTVQKLRAASQRTRCIGNLQRIGVAFQSYHSANRKFPPGGNHAPNAASACVSGPGCREREWSWAYHILPHLGHESIYQNPDASTVRAFPVPVYYCPSRRRPRCSNNRTSIEYAANAGTRPDGSNGVVLRSSLEPISIWDIADGAASTVLVAEKRLNVGELGTGPGDSEGYAAPGWTSEAYRLGTMPPAADVEAPGDLNAFSEFGSSHPGTLNALFADGSVRTIRFTVNPAIWRRACSRDDNQAFNLNDL